MKAFVHFEKDVGDLSLSDIKLRYQQDEKPLQLRRNEVDSRRLINNEDWQRAKQNLGPDAHLAYSRRTLDAWNEADSFVRKNLDAEITPDLLKQIHKVAMRGLPFHGFEGRRLKLRFEKGEISREEFKNLLDKAYSEDAAPSGVDHSTLSGRFRWDPTDDILHSGSSFHIEKKQRYFDIKELNAARANPYIRLDESSVREISPGRFTAKSFYTPPSRVDYEVEKIFVRLKKDLKNAKTDDEYILAAARMQKDLTVVHPFLDGNGRTVRLLRDLILQKRGFPPPILLREKEIELTAQEIADDIKTGMRMYLDARRAVTRGGFSE